MIRRYQVEDCQKMVDLFFDTVHAVNSKDYSNQQITVWAKDNIDVESWNKDFIKLYTLVAFMNDALVGFANIDIDAGFLDKLYVHKDYQRMGIATMLCDKLERVITVSTCSTYASISAVPFFLSRGYRKIRANRVVKDGISLINFYMERDFHVT